MNAENWNIDEYRLIFGSNSFSSCEEEIGLVESARKSRDDFDELARKCQGYVIELSSRYFRKYLGNNVLLEDVIQEGNIALVEAFARYKNNGLARFTTYAFRRINWRIMNYLSNEFRKEHPVEVEDRYERGSYHRRRLIKFSELKDDENPDIISDDVDGNEEFRKEFVSTLKKSIKNLKFSEKEKDIVLSFHGIANGNGEKTKRMNFVELGEKYGFTKERARQIYNKSLARIREDGKLREFYC